MDGQLQFIDGPNGSLAYRQNRADGPGIVWLGGFRSDMLGTKASFLDEWARQRKRSFVRFDYSGHGESDGKFEDGTITNWIGDSNAILNQVADGLQILVGSSMGGWIATALAIANPDRIAAIVFIAPAPDFTERLMWPSLTEDQRQALTSDGRLELPSEYSSEPEIITDALFKDGRLNLVMNGPIPIHCPVKIYHGMNDTVVPWHHGVEFASLLESNDVEITLTKNGDHRLSEPDDLERLERAISTLG